MKGRVDTDLRGTTEWKRGHWSPNGVLETVALYRVLAMEFHKRIEGSMNMRSNASNN